MLEDSEVLSALSKEQEVEAIENANWLSALKEERKVEEIKSGPVEILKRGDRGRPASPKSAPASELQEEPSRSPEPESVDETPLQEWPARGGFRGSSGISPSSETVSQPAAGLPAWIRRTQGHRGSAGAGQERIVSSPLVLGLVASLIVLVAMGYGLAAIIAATTATRAFNRGVQDYDDGDYSTAIRELDSFLEKNPEDPRGGKARVLMAMANVRQYVSVEGGTWTSALEASRRALDEVGGLEEFRDVRADLGELLIRVGEGLADRARSTTDPKALAEAESAVELHAKVARRARCAGISQSVKASRQAVRGPGGRAQGTGFAPRP